MNIDPKLYKVLLETFKSELTEQHQLMIDALLGLEKVKTKKKLQDELGLLFRISHNLKGAAKSVAIDKIASVAHELEDTFVVWRDDNIHPSKEQVNACLELADEMLNAMQASEDGMTSSSYTNDVMLQVPLRRVERVNAKLGELGIFQLRLSNWAHKIKEISNLFHHVEGDMPDKLASIGTNLNGILDSIDKLSGEFSRDLFVLQQEGRKMRLLSIEHVLSPLKRTVHELVESLDKQVELKLEGGSVEVDKSILDMLKTPLQHLVRNAIAHGIEDTDIRKKLNKSIPAMLTIAVSNEAGEIKLRLSDDGQGINVKKLKKLALDKKLYTQTELDEMSDKEALKLVFHSGISTAETVSELSGRGVGLDAVFEDVKRMRGTIDVDSEDGAGCSFTLTLPLAFVSSRGLFVRSQNNTYMLPTMSLESLYEIRSDSLKRVDNQFVKIVNDVPIAVYSLAALLGVGDNTWDTKKDNDGILIGDTHKQIIIMVDEIVQEHDCVLKPLPFPLDDLNYFSGATLSETGELVLVLNVINLLKESLHKDTISLKTEVRPIKQEVLVAKDAARVMVVDDALTTRTLSINALQAAGFDTIDADNGQKAWDMLQQNEIDCVVTDVEMPVLDGLELTRMIKSDEKLNSLPVVIVSSHDKDEDKEKGLKVGASAYLIKNDFDTRSLINMIESLL
ncbi:MAG: response regulator [Legionellaceae bacterium]|nr:response regulator [Legionellaceae bacterium]